MRVAEPRRRRFVTAISLVGALCGGVFPATSGFAATLEIGIGTQNTTTNTVTGGAILKELGLLEKHLPTTGKYDGTDYVISWQNFTSGPPITNGMMANNIQIGMMGDYPLLVNGATGQQTGNQTQLVAVIAYNAMGEAMVLSSTRTLPTTSSPTLRTRQSLSLLAPPPMG